MAKKDIDMENYPFRTFSDEDMQKIKKWERENWIQSAYARKEAFSVTQYYQEVLEEIEYEEHEKMLNVNEEMEERIDSGEIFGKSEKEKKVDFATNEIIDKIRAAGIEVITDKEEFNEVLEYLDELNITLEMLDEKNNYLQKISSENNSELKNGQDTTSAISTPINKNHIIILDKNQENYLNRLNNLSFYKNTPEEFYHNLRKVFDVDNPEKRSGYILQQIEDDYYKLRISNHSVIVKNRTGAKTHQTSIVIKLTEDKRRTNEKARVIEYIYNPDKLTSEKMIGIISGIKDWIKTGIFTDKNYDEQFISNAELLARQNIQKMVTSENTYGFVHNSKIYLNPELMNSNAAVHEYTHLWDAYTQRTNSELWNKGLDLFKNTKYWNEVISDPNYQDIKNDDNLVLSEIHSRICGNIAEKVLNRIAELDGKQVKLDAIDWNKETAGYVLELIKDLNPENSFIQQMKEENIKEDVLAFFNTPMKDLIAENNILKTNSLEWTSVGNARDTDYTYYKNHSIERYFAGININNENTYSVKIDGVPLTFIDEETNEENELYFSEKELDKQILNDTLYYGKSMDEINFDFNNKTSSIISEPSISYMPKKDPAVTRDIINQAKARRASYCHSVVKGEKKGLWKSFNEFQRHGVFDIQGQTLMTDKNGHLTDTGFKQLAISMDIYRDKRFESARYVFVDKDGTIKDQMALSTFMPNHSISKLDETFKQVLEHAEKTNTKIAFVHNHPSGNIEASYDDIQFTKELESYLNQDNKDLFLGHVILDHDTFNCYSPESKWNSVTFEHPGKDRFEKEVPDFAKTVIDGDKKLREIAQSINSTNEYNKNWIPVIFARENASVGGVEYFNKDFFIENDSNVIKNEFEKIGLLCGSDRAIPVVPNGMSYEPELHSEMINKFREGCFYDMALGNRTTTDLHLTKYSNEIFNYTQKEMEEMTKIESTFEPVKVSKKEVGVSSKVAENKTYYVRENIQPVNVKTLLEKHEDIPIFDHKYFVDQKFLPAFTFANNDVYVRCNAKNLAINSELKLNPEKKVDLILSKKQFAQIIATEKLKEKVARMHDFEVNNKAITPIVVAPNNMTALQQDLIFHQNNHLNYTERKEAFSSMYKEIMDNVKQIETKTLSTNQKTILDINQEFNKMQKPNSINSVQKTPGQEYDNSVDFGI